jgi:hypothetical protein
MGKSVRDELRKGSLKYSLVTDFTAGTEVMGGTKTATISKR